MTLDDDILYEPAYTVGQVAGMTGIHPVTVRRWMQGYDYRGRHMDPVFGPQVSAIEDEFPYLISFIQMSELVIAQEFRLGVKAEEIEGQKREPMPLKRIRAAHKFAREQLNLEYPFATVKLRDFGGHIMHEFEDSAGGVKGYLALDVGGNWVLPSLVELAIDKFKYQQDGMAAEFYPLGGEHRLVRVNPRIRGGQPTIDGTGVTVTTVAGRINRGEKRDIVAYDYGINNAAIDAALEVASKLYAA